MSGAYEHNWKKHSVLAEACALWQNKLPLYNLRLNNLSAALIRPQLSELPRRVRDGRRNHDYVAAALSASPYIEVPAPLNGEERAPDSIQFNLVGLDTSQIKTFAESADALGVKVQVFGQSTDNARAFWNWRFLDDLPELPATRSMLMRACDVRLPVQLSTSDLDTVILALLEAMDRTLPPAEPAVA
jgi:dTDP-4-amino-4,6-dideoxygalactose transaminase